MAMWRTMLLLGLGVSLVACRAAAVLDGADTRPAPPTQTDLMDGGVKELEGGAEDSAVVADDGGTVARDGHEPSPDGPELITRLEGESGWFAGGARVQVDPTASGGAVAAFIDAPGRAVAFFGIPATASMTIRYSTANSPGRLGMYVNGSRAATVLFPSTGGWQGSYSTVSIVLSVAEGGTLAFQFDSGDAAANIDALLLSTLATPPVWDDSGGGEGPQPGVFDAKQFLARSAPLTPHEGIPHGVPPDWHWARTSTQAALSPPPNTGNLNWWGVIYVDNSNVHPANTRVEVTNCRLLVLYQGETTWNVYQVTGDYGGWAWKEDFSGGAASFDGRREADGVYSYVPQPGYNAHFWPNIPFQPITKPIRAAFSLGHVRLILHDPSGVDDRDQARYMLQMGSDWRSSDGSCPKNASGQDVCSALGGGRFIYARKSWRAAVMSSMTAEDLATLPEPPVDVFRLPDGTFPTE